MALRGIVSKEDEDEYGNPLAGAATYDISGEQATKSAAGTKAGLLKSAKKPAVGSPITSTSPALFEPARSLTPVTPVKQGKVRSRETYDPYKDPVFLEQESQRITSMEERARTRGRRKLFDTVKGLSEKGKLDPETYDLLKGREGGLVGLTPEQFDKTFQEEGILTSDQTGGLRRKDFASPEAFTRAVEDRNDGQDQPFGSGGALSQAPRELGSRSGAMRRAGRAARRKGATTQANQLFGAAAIQGINEPNIMTEEQRGRVAAKQQEATDWDRQNQAFDKKYMDYANKVIDQRLKGLNSGGGTGRRGHQYRGLGRNPYSNIGSATPPRGL